jgi:hypothetical protein
MPNTNSGNTHFQEVVSEAALPRQENGRITQNNGRRNDVIWHPPNDRRNES